MIKPGRKCLDPLNRMVIVLSVNGTMVTVKLEGSYGATIIYPKSCLRDLP